MDWVVLLGRAKAAAFLAMKQTSHAESAYVDLLSKRRDVGAANALVILLAKQKRYAEAEVWLTKLCEWQPLNAEHWFNAGYMRDALGRRREALAAFEETVRRQPAAYRAWHAIGVIHSALGEHRESVEPLRTACRLNPRNASAVLSFARSLHACGRDSEVAEAAQVLCDLESPLLATLIEETGRQDLKGLVPTAPKPNPTSKWKWKWKAKKS